MTERKRGLFQREARWLVWLVVVPPLVAFVAAILVPGLMRWLGVL